MGAVLITLGLFRTSEGKMRLTINKFDGREHVHFADVWDKDSGQCVGSCHQYHRFKAIKLFGERYRGRFKTFEECAAFVAGVEAVLNEMTSMEIKRPFGAEWPEYPAIKEAS
jgi:hypothetical protein